ncbi:MAG TPA: IPT/TIG domain-containing protein [Acidimicrobiales bacterium]|nr:IPT/TIG domain-containing protein [Acidimicrobiales bacterium]
MRRLGVLSVGSLLAMGLVIGASGSAGAHPATKTPVVTSVVPDHGSTDGGTTVTIKGKNLITATAVTFGSTAAENFTFKSPNTILAISPPGTLGPVYITVTTPVGTSDTTPADVFTYVDTPAIQSLSPRAGASAGKTRVTIIGSDFDGVSTVDFGSIPGTDVTVQSPQVITVISPAEPVGTVDITLTNSDDQTSPLDPADLYTFVLKVPKVKSVSPPNGSEGTPVIISGSGFTKVTAVDFGPNAAAPFTVVNSKTITTTAPAGTGSVDVTVSTAKGTSSVNPADDTFTYNPPEE